MLLLFQKYLWFFSLFRGRFKINGHLISWHTASIMKSVRWQSIWYWWRSWSRDEACCRLYVCVVQWNVLGQTAASKCESFPTFQRLTLSPSSGSYLVEPKRSEDGDGVSPWNVGEPLHLDAAVCPRRFHIILSPQKLQDLHLCGGRKLVYVNVYLVGRNSTVGIATRYGLDGPGIESRWGRDFPHPSRPALGPTQPPVQWVPGLSRG